MLYAYTDEHPIPTFVGEFEHLDEAEVTARAFWQTRPEHPEFQSQPICISTFKSQQQVNDAVVEVLQNARAKVSNGWCQNEPRISAKFCVIGALHAATEPGCGPLFAKACLYFYLTTSLSPHGAPAIALWNDEEGRTQEQVLAAFDKAIELRLSEISTARLSETMSEHSSSAGPGKQQIISQAEYDDMVRVRAYYLWERDKRSDALENWWNACDYIDAQLELNNTVVRG